jgi:hypothetical protein
MVANSRTLSFNYSKGCIRISYEVFQLLGLPPYIRILLNVEEKRIVVLPTDKGDIDRIKPNYQSKSFMQHPRFYSKLLVEKIFITSHWNLDKCYRVNVEFDQDRGVFASDLTKATETEAR